MLTLVNPTAHSCYWTIIQYDHVGGQLYGRSLSDWRFLYFNIVYHFGEIFANIKGLFKNSATGGDKEENYFKIGGNVGWIVWYTLADLEDFEYPDITIVYPPEFDDDWV